VSVYHGTVQNNTIVLPPEVRLPEGAGVEVRVVETPLSREELFARALANPRTDCVGIDEIIAEDKKEREERADRWLQ
jgi:hypothetical protein